MKVRGELSVTESTELLKAVAQELLCQNETESPEELFKKGKKISNELHGCGNTGDNNDCCCKACP